MRIALAFNLKRIKPRPGGFDDEDAEYDAPSTIQAIADALASHGHEVEQIEADASFVARILGTKVDVVFNVAEGARGKSREAQVPALLELLGIPYTGSDPACFVLTLDKAVAKSIVSAAGVRTPRSVVVTAQNAAIPADMSFPVIVKPVAEGSSKGVLPASVAETNERAREIAIGMAERYRQGALVEEYLPGREFTVGILGDPPVVLAPMEVVLRTKERYPVYSFDHKLVPNDEVVYEVPAKIDGDLDRTLRTMSLRAFEALGCRDVARVDLRLDAQGVPSFIECNPLPGLTPGWSDLCLIGEGEGIDYRSLIGRILAPAIARASLSAGT